MVKAKLVEPRSAENDCCLNMKEMVFTDLKAHRFHPALSKKVLFGVTVRVLGARVLRAGWRSLPADTRLRAKDIACLCSVSCSMVFTSKFNIISLSMPLPSKVYKGSVDLAARIA